MAQTTKEDRDAWRKQCLEYGTAYCISEVDLIRLLDDADSAAELEAQIVGMMENVGELAWGIDLPTPFLVMPPLDPNADPDEPVPKPVALPPQEVTPFYEAIYQKWKKNSDLGHLLRDLRRENYELEAEVKRLQAQQEDDTGLISDLRSKEDDYERLRYECEQAKSARDRESGRADRLAVKVAELQAQLARAEE